MKIRDYTPPITISLIWHPADLANVQPILNTIKQYFARHKDKPFSHGINIPLFFYSSQSINEAPTQHPADRGECNIFFVFTSLNTLGREKWKGYIESFPLPSSSHIVPIALDSEGLRHGGTLDGVNCIRVSDWPTENRLLHAAVSVAHEVYRFGIRASTDSDLGKLSSITLFISHSKSGDTGLPLSVQIKSFIDNTNMNRFFDANDISPGHQFSKEIENHIKNSTLLVIESDSYSSRYWCQREILIAKANSRPVIVIDCLEDYEDRIFPAASNVPRVHLSPDSPASSKDILRVLSSAIFETIRHGYAIQCLHAYRAAGWIDPDCELSPRPPEIRQVIEVKNKGKLNICYPEPPLYSDEADWHKQLGITAFTPLWSPKELDKFAKEKIGISISDTCDTDLIDTNMHPECLTRLAQDLARHLLARSATLIYGGDLRPNGFTEFILEEAGILKDRIPDTNPLVENHLAWPLYISDPEITAWRATHHKVMKTVECRVPDDIALEVEETIFLTPNTTQNSYIWSRCLTEMRERSVSASTIRICAGGKLSGYRGQMPGVLEEIQLALKTQKPLYLLGAFGGVVSEVCKVILTKEVPETLTEDWQISHNYCYSELQNLARSFGHECVYETVIDLLSGTNIFELSARCGLAEFEYRRLMVSPFEDECVHLVLKGIGRST